MELKYLLNTMPKTMVKTVGLGTADSCAILLQPINHRLTAQKS